MHILIVHYDDWVEMFIDGTSVLEGHSIRLADALRECGLNVTTRSATKAEEIEKSGYDPEG